MPERSESEERDGHVLEELVELAAGRLPPARAREVQEHLGSCPECAAQHRFILSLREDLTAQGAVHLRPMRLVELSENALLPPTPEEAAHLEACARCREELHWSSSVPPLEALPPVEALNPGAPEIAAARLPRAPARGEPLTEKILGALRLSWLRWAALGAAAAGLVLLVSRYPLSPASNTARLARIAPLPVPQETRGAEGNPAFQEAFQKALRLYAAGDYKGAAEAIMQATTFAPRQHEIYLYLGSSELLQRDARGAVSTLRIAAKLADSPRLQEECQWQLANALLLAGQADSARAHLIKVIAFDSDRRSEAEALLGSLRRER